MIKTVQEYEIYIKTRVEIFKYSFVTVPNVHVRNGYKRIKYPFRVIIRNTNRYKIRIYGDTKWMIILFNTSSKRSYRDASGVRSPKINWNFSFRHNKVSPAFFTPPNISKYFSICFRIFYRVLQIVSMWLSEWLVLGLISRIKFRWVFMIANLWAFCFA